MSDIIALAAIVRGTRIGARRRLSPGRWLLQAGATAVEYALLVALIAGAVIVSVATLGQRVEETLGCVSDSVEFLGPECEEDPALVATSGKRKRKKRR